MFQAMVGELKFRGYLPHLDAPSCLQHVVFRLADALPATVQVSIAARPGLERLDEAEAFLDAGHGSRALADPRVAQVVQDTLLAFDGVRYQLAAWCVMPTHVHVLAMQSARHPLAAVVHSWKSFSANRANALLGRRGRFWAPDYFDRFMRSDEQADRTAAYIEHNPVAAGLCKAPDLWPCSSAALREKPPVLL